MYDDNNVFAKILKTEIASEIVFSNEFCICFKDINPVAKTHLLVIPRMPVLDYADFISKSAHEYISGFFISVKEITEKFNLKSYKLLTNKGSKAGQQVFHFHVHIISEDVMIL